MKQLVQLLRLLLAGSVLCASVRAAEPVVVNVDAENPPFMSSQDGKAVGFYPTVLYAAFARCNESIRLEAKPWKRALAEIDHWQAGIAGVYKTEERIRKYDFSEPIFVENIIVYFNMARPFAFASISDLYGKRVGVIRGWSYGEVFDEARRDGKIAAEEVASDRSNFLKLADGRLDAVLAIEEAGRAVIAAEGLRSIDQANVGLASNPAYLAFNKAVNKTRLLVCFDKALAELKQDGTLERIVRQELSR